RASAFLEDAQRWLAEPVQTVGPSLSLDGAASETAEHRPLLLVADDNADIRAYITRLLQERGQVHAVGDGAAALTVARVWTRDLIVAALMMPGLDGLALLQAVRAEPKLCLIPFIMLSARADEHTRVELLRSGADDYLVKPFAAAELLARVDGQLESLRVRGE